MCMLTINIGNDQTKVIEFDPEKVIFKSPETWGPGRRVQLAIIADNGSEVPLILTIYGARVRFNFSERFKDNNNRISYNISLDVNDTNDDNLNLLRKKLDRLYERCVETAVEQDWFGTTDDAKIREYLAHFNTKSEKKNNSGEPFQPMMKVRFNSLDVHDPNEPPQVPDVNIQLESFNAYTKSTSTKSGHWRDIRKRDVIDIVTEFSHIFIKRREAMPCIKGSSIIKKTSESNKVVYMKRPAPMPTSAPIPIPVVTPVGGNKRKRVR